MIDNTIFLTTSQPIAQPVPWAAITKVVDKFLPTRPQPTQFTYWACIAWYGIFLLASLA